MSIYNLVSNISKLRQWYSTINPANMTGAIDVIVIQQPDGTYLSSPFHVRFGKYGVLKAKEKIVDIEVNEAPVDIHMKLDDNGAAYFVEQEDEDGKEIPPELATSPIPQDPLFPLVESDDSQKGSDSSRSSCNGSKAAKINSKDVTDDTPKSDDALNIRSPMSGSQQKTKSNRKKRKRRSLPFKHSRNSSKTSMREILNEEEQAADGDDDGDSDASIDFPCDDMDKENFDQISHSNDERKNSGVSISSVSRTDDCDRLSSGQSEAISFLASRLPDLEKLDSILEQQAELEKSKFGDESSGYTRESLTVDTSTNRNYFSEPDLTPVTSPVGSRPPSPVLSDSELEVPQKNQAAAKPEEQRWEWGQLPTSAVSESLSSDKQLEQKSLVASNNAPTDTKDKSGWGIPFLWPGRQSKPVSNTSQDENHGIYLDDLKDDDAEMMQIYVGGIRQHRESTRSLSGSGQNGHIEEDAESGHGPSLPTSPNSLDVTISSQIYEENHRSFRTLLPEVEISLCGGLEGENPPFSSLFEQSKVSFDDFVLHLQRADPSLFTNPNLVVRIGDQYYKWSAACPIIMSTILYGRQLPSDLVEIIRGPFQETPQKDTLSPGNNDSNSNQAKKKQSSLWWPFGSRREDDVEKNDLAAIPKDDAELAAIEEVKKTETLTNEDVKAQTTDAENTLEGEKIADETLQKDRFKKTLRLSSNDIERLNLHPGSNELQFSVTTAFQGTSRCSCHLYLWKWSDKIVISDIDGTITKSDVLGHVLPVIGKDWAQSGVADLFTKIVGNGYQMIYLSARAIGQASFTKDYLASVRQGEVNLPDGPLLLNPTSLMNAFHREVIERAPEKFKIACLNDIKKLFPPNHNPFFAGYGNRTNDVVAYTTVGIPISRVFTINTKGEIKHEAQMFRTSYSDQSNIVDHIFPSCHELDVNLQVNCNPYTQLEYSNFAFWREPPIELEPEEVREATKDSPKTK